MKKLISLILILCMACMLVPAMAEDAAGIWYAVEMTSEGLTIKPAEVGMSMTLELKEDGTAEMVMEMAGQKDTDAGTWSVEGDTLSMTFKEATLTATIADGKFAMEQDGANITFSKEAPEVATASPVAAESEADFLGNWTLAAADVMGMHVTADLMSAFGIGSVEISLLVEEGKATLSSNQSESAGVMTTAFQDGKLILTAGDVTIPVEKMDDGTIALPFSIESLEVTIYLAPAAAAEEPAA